jgi:hypothetical protein
MNIFKAPPRLSHWFAHATVIATLMLLSRAHWVFSNLYHGGQSVENIGLAITALLGLVMLILVPIAIMLPVRVAEAALRILTVSVAAYVFWPAMRALPIVPQELSAIYKIGLIGGVFTLAVLAAIKLTPELWRRMQTALVFAGILYVAFPMVVTRMTDPLVLQMPRQGALVVLLLDELNADAGEQIAAAIALEGGEPRTRSIKAVGSSTITVIPELFGGPHMPQARVCSPSAVCDPSGVFDFSRLRFEPLDRMHMVGFYHPYCAADGLASCARLPIAISMPPIADLLCSFGSVLPGTKAGDCDWLQSGNWHMFGLQVRDAMLLSPFWQKGGVLYAHLPFPHPPGNLQNAGLASDYADNLNLAANTAALVWRRGRAQFGDDFRLIVTSDHPLRPELYCRHEKYKKTGCNIKSSAFPGFVPYIEVGREITDESKITDNEKLFKKLLAVENYNN